MQTGADLVPMIARNDRTSEFKDIAKLFLELRNNISFIKYADLVNFVERVSKRQLRAIK